MTDIDVVILADSKNDYLKAMTDNCLGSLLKSEAEIKFNVFINEAQYPSIDWKEYGVHCGNIAEPFNYNKFMNVYASLGKSDYIAFCNNDLDFEQYWASNIISEMDRHRLDSASPYCKQSRFMKRITPTGKTVMGYHIGMYFAGWCFVMRRKAFEKIGGLDEDFNFWCADNATAEQLKQHNLIHGLVTSSKVTHLNLGENTLKTIEHGKEDMTFNLIKKFNRKYNQDVWGMGID